MGKRQKNKEYHSRDPLLDVIRKDKRVAISAEYYLREALGLAHVKHYTNPNPVSKEVVISRLLEILKSFEGENLDSQTEEVFTG